MQMTPYKVKKVSVVIPVFNESGCLDELIDRCLKACRGMKGKKFEIILVDDGSEDGSVEIISSSAAENKGEIVACILNRNYGQHSAIMAGFTLADGEVVITLDADLQNPPEEIPALVAEAEKGYEVVGTIRQKRQDSLFRKTASAIVNKIAQKATGVKMKDYGCMLRAYHQHVIKAMLECHERSTFIPVLANSFARYTTEIGVAHSERNIGDSKYSLMKLVNLQFNLLTCMTTFPLRLLSMIGGAISALGMLFGVFLLVMRLVYGPEWAAQGVFTLFSLLFILAGFQLVGMGLLGEYIGRIYHDVRARPRYYIQDIIGKNKS